MDDLADMLLDCPPVKPVQHYDESRQAFVSRIEAEGEFKVVYPDDNQLFIDVDSEAQYKVFKNALEVFNKNCPSGVKVEERPSQSGLPKRHITVTLPFEVDLWQRIAWQGAFGSDPTREMLSAFRIRNEDPFPTLFVERK